jgi:hypothetical protein
VNNHRTAAEMNILRHLFSFSATVAPEWRIMRPEVGSKLSICLFQSGQFEGPRLSGTVLPVGGDWAEYQSARLLRIYVRGLLRTHDGDLIALDYRGLWATPPGVLERVLQPGGDQAFVAAENYLRVVASFETDSPKYSWMNEILAIGVGQKTADGIHYEFYEVL